tara:strand:+ start:131 stop:715 length:585 start_codon:yes stop_codon:yes gene_type:complete
MGIIDSLFKIERVLTRKDGPFTTYTYDHYDGSDATEKYIHGHALHATSTPGVLSENTEHKHQLRRHMPIDRIGTIRKGEYHLSVDQFHHEERVPGKYPTIWRHNNYIDGKSHGVQKTFYKNKVLKSIHWDDNLHGVDGSYQYEYNEYGELIKKDMIEKRWQEASSYYSAGWSTIGHPVDLIDDNPDKKYEGIYL